MKFETSLVVIESDPTYELRGLGKLFNVCSNEHLGSALYPIAHCHYRGQRCALCALNDNKCSIKCYEKESTKMQHSVMNWTLRSNHWKDEFKSHVEKENSA